MRPKLIRKDPKLDKIIQTEAITDISTQNQPKQAKTNKAQLKSPKMRPKLTQTNPKRAKTAKNTPK